MKKLVILMVVLMVSVSVFAEDLVDGYVEFNYFPFFSIYDYTDTEEEYFTQGLFMLSLGLEKDFSFLTVGGNIDTYMMKMNSNYSFSPVNNEYIVFLEANISDFTIGYEHSCSHPQNPNAGLIETTLTENTSSGRVYGRFNF